MSIREQFEAWLSSEYQWANDTLNEAHFHGDDATGYYTGGDFIYDGRSCSDALFWAWRGWQENHQQGEAKCAALSAECHGFKRFFMFAINAAFDGCDITGDQIQEVAKEIGLVRVEPYSEAKHAEMSGDPSVMEEGDDFYIMNKTPATDAFLAEVRNEAGARAVELFAQTLGSPYAVRDEKCYEDGFTRAIEIVRGAQAPRFAAQLRKGVRS